MTTQPLSPLTMLLSRHTRRRTFMSLLGGAAAAWPLAARAQQPGGMRGVGGVVVIAENDPEAQPRIAAFLAGLQAFGWKDGRNVRIDYRWAADDTGRMRAYATELIDTAPDVIFVSSTPALAALG